MTTGWADFPGRERDPGSRARSESGPDGPLVAVVGPSGSGKDSLIGCVRERFAGARDLHVARRVITRDPEREPGGEPHESVDEAAFDARLARGEFAVHWRAHGLRYGVPARVRDDLADGGVVLVNGSRAALPDFADAFPTLLVVHVTVESGALARRLVARGREGEADIRARLARDAPLDPALGERVRELDNGGPLELAATRLIGWLETLRAGRPPARADTTFDQASGRVDPAGSCPIPGRIVE